MRFVPIAAFFALAGCGGAGGSLIQSSVFAQPSVVYHNGNNLEVQYLNGGIQQSFNEANAMELLRKECNGAFRIVNRTSDGPRAYVDAVCGQ